MTKGMRVLAGAATLCIAITGCSRKESGETPAAPADQTCTLRAEVTALPSPPQHGLMLHHEAVAGFVNAQGVATGMEEMEMPFSHFGSQASVNELRVGDLVEATLEVRWKSEPHFLITQIHKLPAGTKLNIGPIKEGGT